MDSILHHWLEQFVFWLLLEFILIISICCRVNFWGYSTVNFFSPMIRYSSAGIRNCGRDGINEMKFLIKEAHKRGIEVNKNIYDMISFTGFCFFFIFKWNYVFIAILLLQVIMDVVFNHTAEGNENGPIISFRGVDNSIYYMVAPKVSSIFLLPVSTCKLGLRLNFFNRTVLG